MAKKVSKSSKRWLQRSIKDQYSNLAQKFLFRSRAIFKLQDIDNKYNILSRANTVLDLGSSPGSWLQYIKQKTSEKSLVIGIDLKPMEAIPGVILLQGDFTDSKNHKRIVSICSKKFDIICSDMAPQTIGDKLTDHLRIMSLAESAFEFACNFQAVNGHLIIKIFQGKHASILVEKIRKFYKKVSYFKPKTSYKDSSEIFIIALYFKP